jgi:hypothetical protein
VGWLIIVRAGLLAIRSRLRQADRAWRRVCLRQAGQLSCNPLGIIAGLAVMVGTVELWKHDRDTQMWLILLAVCAAIVLVPLVIVWLLRPMTVVSSPRNQQRSTVAAQPATVPPPRPDNRRPDSPRPDSVERPREPERIKEPA